MNARVTLEPGAEKYISKMLNKKIPYKVNILDYEFTINTTKVYPPGKLTVMFIEYLLENNLIKNKTIADIGASCFALGIIAANNGAKYCIGTDINRYAIDCANENIKLNGTQDNTMLIQGAELQPLFPKFKSKIDLLLCGIPWDTISVDQYINISQGKKNISRFFYDVDNKLITSILLDGKKILSSDGRVFITSAMSKINRIKKLCQKYNVNYQIVKQADIHNDGDLHYIVELIFDKSSIKV